MKKIFLILAIISAGVVYKPVEAGAQISISINIGLQPVWGPVGYDYVDYYYLPDMEVYYYVPRQQFIYLSNGEWIVAASLPYRYRSYNLYTGYKVVINEPRPYLQFQSHKVIYSKYKGNSGKQVIIKNSGDPKYYVVKGHPKYKKTGGSNGNSKRKGKGSGNGKSKQ